MNIDAPAVIRKANMRDATTLTDLTIRSKSFWGYGEEQINLWREDLTITTDYLQEHAAYLIELNNGVPGYYSFYKISEEIVKLDNLFIAPDFIRKGFGKILLDDFMHRARHLNYKKVTLDADPNAERFYLKYGFKTIGQLETSIKDRFMPVMEREL